MSDVTLFIIAVLIKVDIRLADNAFESSFSLEYFNLNNTWT